VLLLLLLLLLLSPRPRRRRRNPDLVPVTGRRAGEGVAEAPWPRLL